MKLAVSIGLALLCGLVLYLLPFQFDRPGGDRGVAVTWLNFVKYRDLYESTATAFPAGIAVAFAPVLLALEWRFLRPSVGRAILLTLEGLLLIGGAGALWLAMTLSHANFMTGYSTWKTTPILFALPGYGILTGIVCLVAPWSMDLRNLLVRCFDA